MQLDTFRNRLALGLALVPLLVGCAHDQRTVEQKINDHTQAARKAIQEHVHDAARARKLLDLTAELDRVLLEQSGALGAFTQQLHAANADPATNGPALRSMIDGYLGERQARRTRCIEIHFQMIELTQPDEWKHIVDAEMAALTVGTSLGEA